MEPTTDGPARGSSRSEEHQTLSRRRRRAAGEAARKPAAAKEAATASNHWFGGDVSALYTAIGEKSPVKPVRTALMPNDRAAFARAVFATLGGRPFNRHTFAEDREVAREQQQEQTRYWRFRDLAEDSLRYIQLEEALGEAPTLDQFGRRKFSYIAEEVWGDIDNWRVYTDAIAKARSPSQQHAKEDAVQVAGEQRNKPREPEHRSLLGRLLGRG